MYDTIIIGGGPAGITAAIYAARKQMKYAIVIKETGGEVAKTTTIENYPGYKSVTGEELSTLFDEHMRGYAPELLEDEVVEVRKTENGFIVKTYEKELETHSIILTSGAVPRALNIPGEQEFRNRGVSWCTTCDGPLFADKEVAIIGAGNTGLTSTVYMMNIARKVYLISKYDKPKADPVLIDKATANSKVEIINNAKTVSINGKKFVESITISANGLERTIPVQGVFINIGYVPNTGFLNGLVATTPAGEIITDKRGMTSVPGIFAAGDVTDTPHKQIVIAAGEGSKALLSAYDYVSQKR